MCNRGTRFAEMRGMKHLDNSHVIALRIYLQHDDERSATQAKRQRVASQTRRNLELFNVIDAVLTPREEIHEVPQLHDGHIIYCGCHVPPRSMRANKKWGAIHK